MPNQRKVWLSMQERELHSAAEGLPAPSARRLMSPIQELLHPQLLVNSLRVGAQEEMFPW